MGRLSTKKEKNIFQLSREEKGMSREKASELMTGMSPSRIEKIENGQEPTPFDVVQMADCYQKPELCNYYCSHRCEIGNRYVPHVTITDLPMIILETIGSLNSIMPHTNRLIQIARDGKITDDEMSDFAYISNKLDEISLAVEALNLWVDRTAGINQLNVDLLRQMKKSIKETGMHTGFPCL